MNARTALWALVLPNLMLSRQGRRNGWTGWHALSAYILVALGVALTWEAWADIFHIALIVNWKAWPNPFNMISIHDEEASHILLVPMIVAWLLFVRGERLRYCRPTGQWIGPVVIAAGWLVASLGYYNNGQAFWHGGSIMVVVGCLLTVVGAEVLRRFAPAFAVLIFLVPFPGSIRDDLAQFLQTWLTTLTSWTFGVLGEDVKASGNVLTINGVEVQVAEACNGMRMVFTLVLVAYAVAFGTPLKGYVRFLLIAVSIPFAFVANFIRIVPTVWLFGHASSETALAFHDVAGWVMLVVAFLMLLAIVWVLRWAMLPVARYTLAYD